MSQIPEGYWGNLTPEHQKCLETVRSQIEDLPSRYTDQVLLRFLRARSFDVHKAVLMINNDIIWRKENGVDTILETFKSNKHFKMLTEYWPGGCFGVDKNNMPVYFEAVGMVDPKSLFKTVSAEDLIMFHIYMMELTDSKVREAAKNVDLSIVDQGILYVQDLAGLSMKHTHPSGLAIVKTLAQTDQDHYPEVMRRTLLVNSPSLFSFFWRMISPWIDPRTVAKLEVQSADYQQALISEGLQPDALSVLKGKGGFFGDVSDDATTVVIAAMDKFEHPVIIEKEESIIGWHFRTESNNIGFAVHFENEKGQRMELIPYSKYESHEEPVQSHVVANLKGRYVLHWDNSFSFMRKKTLKYEVILREPSSE